MVELIRNPLQQCVFLPSLNLNTNHIRELSPIRGACRLRIFSANDNVLSGRPNLDQQSGLISLSLSCNILTDIKLAKPIAEPTNLDFSLLGNCFPLQALKLSEDSI